MKKSRLTLASAVAMVALTSIAFASSEALKQASDDVIKEQRHMLSKNTDGAGFGPRHSFCEA